MHHRLQRIAILSSLLTAGTVQAQQVLVFDTLGGIGLPNQIGGVQAQWSDFLGASFDESTTFGGITGSPNTTVIPEVSLFGETIIPAVQADTRTGLEVTAFANGQIGLQMDATFSAGGLTTQGAFEVRPELTLPDHIGAGQWFGLNSRTDLIQSPTLAINRPNMSLQTDLVFDVTVGADFKGGLFPLVPYGESGFSQTIGSADPTTLLDVAIDLNDTQLSDSGNLVSALGVGIPGSQWGDFDKGNDPYFHFKVPTGQANTNLSFGELLVANPLKADDNFVTQSNVINRHNQQAASVSMDGSLLGLGLDIDGIASAAVFGSSLTGMEVPIHIGGKQVGTFQYDIADMKVGAQMGLSHDASITPEITVTLAFDQPVLIETESGTTTTDTWTGLWSQLPNIATLASGTTNVTATVDAVRTALNSQTSLTISDYEQLRLFGAKYKQAGVPLVSALSVGPLVSEKTSLLGDVPILLDQTTNQTVAHHLADPSILGRTFSFALQADATHVYPVGVSPSLDQPNHFRHMTTGQVVGSFDGTSVVIGHAPNGTAANTLGMSPIQFVDRGNLPDLFDLDFTVVPDVAIAFLNWGFDNPTGQVFEVIVPEGSRYALAENHVRAWGASRLTNDGQFDASGWTRFAPASKFLRVDGSGDMDFDGPTQWLVDRLEIGEGQSIQLRRAHAQGHQVRAYNGISSQNGDFVVQHAGHQFGRGSNFEMQVDGRLFANNTAVDIQGQTLTVGSTGQVGAMQALGNLTLDFQTLTNLGTIEAKGNLAKVHVHARTIRGLTDSNADGTGPTPARFTAKERSTMRFGSAEHFGTRISGRADIEAIDHSHLVFENPLIVGAGNQVEIAVDATSDATFHGLSGSNNALHLTNQGTMVFASGDNSLNHVTLASGDAQTLPGLVAPIQLDNQGTVQVLGGAKLAFDVRLLDVANSGAALRDGTWQLLGQDAPHSNRQTNTDLAEGVAQGVAVIETPVTQITGEAFNGAFLEASAWPDDLDTTLKRNFADVTFSGKAHWAYFNTVTENHGALRIQRQHQFETEGDFTNTGLLALSDRAQFVANGRLTIDHGTVAIDDTSTLVFAGDGIEVIGSHVSVPKLMVKPGLAFDGHVPEGKHVVVRQGHDTATGAATPAHLRLPNIYEDETVLLSNQGTIELDGALASLAGSEWLIFNEGTLRLKNGNTLHAGPAFFGDERFQNSGTLELINGGSLVLPGEYRQDLFANTPSNPSLVIDANSHLQADTVNLLVGHARIDGVIDANNIHIASAVSLEGSGRFVSNLTNDGWLEPGESPGLLEVWGDFSQNDSATLAMEIEGMVPGSEHDQLIVHGNADLDGTLVLSFADDWPLVAGQTWLLFESQTMNGWFDAIHIEGLELEDTLANPSIMTMDDHTMHLGSVDGIDLLLSHIVPMADTGNHQVQLLAVPEPQTLLLALFGVGLGMRRRRPCQHAA